MLIYIYMDMELFPSRVISAFPPPLLPSYPPPKIRSNSRLPRLCEIFSAATAVVKFIVAKCIFVTFRNVFGGHRTIYKQLGTLAKSLAPPPSTTICSRLKNKLRPSGCAALKAPSAQLKHKYFTHLIVAFWTRHSKELS